MKDKLREFFDVKLANNGGQILIPRLTFHFTDDEMEAPAAVERKENCFQFTVFFEKEQHTVLNKLGIVRNAGGKITLSGALGGDLAFSCESFPYLESRGGGRNLVIVLDTQRLEIEPIGSDALSHEELLEILSPGQDHEPLEYPFVAEAIFRGPDLWVRSKSAGTQTMKFHEFLGESSTESADTYLFEDETYQFAVVKGVNEIALHLKAKTKEVVEGRKLFDSLIWSLGFSHGFLPWPYYFKINNNGKLIEQWVTGRCEVKQSSLAPLMPGLWVRYIQDDFPVINQMVPDLAYGFRNLSYDDRKRLKQLYHVFRATTESDLPFSVKISAVNSVLDGLLQVIASSVRGTSTDRFWKLACSKLSLNWDEWMEGIYQLRPTYRNDVAHGRLWVVEDDGFDNVLENYSKLSHAFLIICATWLGYDGVIASDYIKGEHLNIDEKIKKGQMS